MKSRLGYKYGKILLAILLVSPAFAAVALDGKVGLSGAFVPGRFAPVRISVSSETPFEGSLRISQQVGNPWRGEAVIEREIPLRFAGRFEQEEILPIYDFTHPLQVLLLDAAGTPLLTKEIALRPGWRKQAFPVLVGDFPDVIEPEAVSLDPRELPAAWPGYQAVESLWLGRLNRVPSREQWIAITQWVLAGGTLVLFTGEDFYRLEAPWVQDLLPFTDLHVQQEEDGLYTLRGEPRPGAEILLTTSDGSSLLVSQRYGAGTILLVTRSAFETSASELTTIRAQVPPAELLSLAEVRQSLLEDTPFDRPGYTMALLVIVLSLGNLAVVTFLPKTAATTLALVVATTILLALLSGFYINQTKAIKGVYIINTKFSVLDEFGITANYSALYATRDTQLELKVREETAITQEIPQVLRDYNYDTTWEEGSPLSLRLRKHEQRNLLVYTPLSPSSSIAWTVSGLVPVKTTWNSEFGPAFLVIDGVAFPVGPIPSGTEDVQVKGPGMPLEDVTLQPASVNLLYRSLIGRFPLERGVWLIGGSERITREDQDQIRQKVRDIHLYLVQGETLEEAE